MFVLYILCEFSEVRICIVWDPGFLIRFLDWNKLAQAKLWVSHCILTAPTMLKIELYCQHPALHEQYWPMLFYCCANVVQVLSHYWAKEHLPAPFGAP